MDMQRTVGNGATASYVHQLQVQRYEDRQYWPLALPAPDFDQASGDQLPAFAENEPTVTVSFDEEGALQGTVERHRPAEHLRTLSWSNDETMAINPMSSVKEFYAVPAVVAAANKSLAEMGSNVRLVQGGHSLANRNGNRLTVVRPRLRTDTDDVARTRFMHLVQHECEETAKAVTGGDLGQAVFRGPDGNSVLAAKGPANAASGLTSLADALSSAQPPMTPQEAAQAVSKPGLPEHAPGERYGKGLLTHSLRDSEQATGINDYASARVGEALATHTINAEQRKGVSPRWDYSQGRVNTAGRIWVFHYGAVVAESTDRRDQITLENFNRRSLKDDLLAQAAHQTALAYATANPGQTMTDEDAKKAAKEVLGDQIESTLGDTWYFKMYEPGGARSFHSQNRAATLNPMTVATTTTIRPAELFFQDRSDVLESTSASQIQKIAERWRDSERQIIVEGHASGGVARVRNLARKRANATADRLVQHGIARNRITVKSDSQSDRQSATIKIADRPAE
jgi:outer membrane protein OmpA-like peptidoglycan-associated protein